MIKGNVKSLFKRLNVNCVDNKINCYCETHKTKDSELLSEIKFNDKFKLFKFKHAISTTTKHITKIFTDKNKTREESGCLIEMDDSSHFNKQTIIEGNIEIFCPKC